MEQMTAQQLVTQIAEQQQSLRTLQHQLTTLQQTCDHQFQDERNHRICVKCHYAKSLHY